jgi:type I restriction enzyme S subunit
MIELPKGWTTATLNDLLGADGIFSDGDWIESKDQDPDGANRLLQLADIGDGLFVDKSSRYVNDEKFSILNCTELKEGDVLIARMPAPLGRACLLPAMPQRCLTVVDIAVFRAGNTGVSNKWLMHFLNSSPIRREMELNSSGTTRKRISRGKLGEILLSVPPIAEQTRIATKLDQLLAQINTLKNRIDGIPALLKRFRQSVLAAAVSGRMTEEWRQHAENKSAPLIAQFGTLIKEIRNGLSAKPNEEGKGFPILRISSVRAGSIDQTEIRFLECDDDEKERYTLKVGDLLFTRYNGSLDLVGVCGLVRQLSHTNLLYPDKLIRVRCNTDLVLPEYLEIFFSELSTRQRVMDLVKSTSGQKGISGQDLKAMVVTCPNLPEQAEISRRVEQLFTIANQLESKVASAKIRIDNLTQSLLAKAFHGELMPQDPSDEPASMLLKRIAASKLSKPAKLRQSRPPQSTRMTKKSNAMTKHRQDEDVLGQPYLAGHLRRLGSKATSEVLFKVAELPVADFYKQLAWEVTQGLVVDLGETLEAKNEA